MLPVDPSYSTCHNCSVMCCQHTSLEQHDLRQRAREAYQRALSETNKNKNDKKKDKGGPSAFVDDDGFQRMQDDLAATAKVEDGSENKLK